jgi:hypothetical protein
MAISQAERIAPTTNVGTPSLGRPNWAPLPFVTNLQMSPTLAKDGDEKSDLKTRLSPTSPT